MMCVCVYAGGTQASTMTPFLLPNRSSDEQQFADDNTLCPKVASI